MNAGPLNSRNLSLLTLIIALAWLPAHAKRPYAVHDSIELSTFGGNGITKFSPDGRRFFAVTTRGLLPSNHLESTIWIFDTSKVRRSVSSDLAGRDGLCCVL